MIEVLAVIVALATGGLLGWIVCRSRMLLRIIQAETERNVLVQFGKEAEERSLQRTEIMKTEFENLAQKILEQENKKLRTEGEDSLTRIVAPLKENLNRLGESLQDLGERDAAGKATFEQAMKILSEQTTKVGMQADNLTRALKGETKTQGYWGEMILSSILESSGLREGEEYITQENVKSEQGSNKYPDVVVNFPDGHKVIVDAKVSLTAYMDSLNATDEVSQKQTIKSHVQSVRKHIEELSSKNYYETVKDSQRFVLMFLQSDAAYILALKNDSRLQEYAFSKRVIITSPTTLMMTLQIIHNIWQSDRQTKNVEKIVEQANSMYDKMVTFLESFTEIKKSLDRAASSYEQSFKQLGEGRGNVIKKLDDLRKLGVTPKKQIPVDFQTEES